MKKTPLALTIAGLDPSGGAGIQADLRMFELCGVYGLSVATVVTAQNSIEVQAAFPLGANVVETQLSTLFADFSVEFVKIGILGSAANVRVVAKKLGELKDVTIVLDPVLTSTTGKVLTDETVLKAMEEELFPLVTVLTPNFKETEALSGIEITSEQEARAAFQTLSEKGIRYLALTGLIEPGKSRESADNTTADMIKDLLIGNGTFLRAEHDLIRGLKTHGTGCSFSSALTAGMAKGMEVENAFIHAAKTVEKGLKNGFLLGRGRRLLATPDKYL